MAKKSLSNPLPLLAHLLEQTNCLPPKPSGRLHYWGEEGTGVPGAATAVFFWGGALHPFLWSGWTILFFDNMDQFGSSLVL
jgi:hypothetical protein